MSGDVVVAGVIGLAAAHELQSRGHRVVVLEKSAASQNTQTGRNFGVVHSGLYNAPGSRKAAMTVAGAGSMRNFDRGHGVAVDICGKLVVASNEGHVPALRRLLERGRANGVPVREIDPAEAREYEPYVSCVAALRVESSGIVDFRGVSETQAEAIAQRGGEIRFGAEVVRIRTSGRRVTVSTADDTIHVGVEPELGRANRGEVSDGAGPENDDGQRVAHVLPLPYPILADPLCAPRRTARASKVDHQSPRVGIRGARLPGPVAKRGQPVRGCATVPPA